MSPESGAAGSFGIGIASSIMSGLGERAKGKQEQAAYDYNADIDLQNMRGEMVANEQRYSQLVGKQATAYAAAGVDITSGSPLLMMAATAGRGGRQAAEIYESGTEAANLQRYYGKVAAWRGNIAGIGAMLGGISKASTAYLSATGYEGGGDPGETDYGSVSGTYMDLGPGPSHG